MFARDMNLQAKPDRSARSWHVWAALWVVYIVWGSTYLAIRIAVETAPPLLSAGARFLIAGVGAYLLIGALKGWRALRVSGREILASSIVGGALLLGGNGLVMVAEQSVGSGLASLTIASVPLWVILLRKLARETIPTTTLVGVLVGFVGVALLLMPRGGSASSATGLLLLVAAAASWATGSFFAKRLALPKDIFLSTAVQMICGGALLTLTGLATGEAVGFSISQVSTASWLALLYLVVAGSWLAFTAYVWLLQHAPISKVATYAYVNPVIAIVLGWLVLSESFTPLILAGAALVVSSVVFIVRQETDEPERAHRAQPEFSVGEAALASERA
ncbi:MAG TPA: EamA family transporter [Actinomycetota bacterium]|nr:EamA family transporter [Actinomycetota bacterium]